MAPCRFVYVWDTTSRRILYKLPGHAGSINEVAFHPDEPISKSTSALTATEEKAASPWDLRDRGRQSYCVNPVLIWVLRYFGVWVFRGLGFFVCLFCVGSWVFLLFWFGLVFCFCFFFFVGVLAVREDNCQHKGRCQC